MCICINVSVFCRTRLAGQRCIPLFTSGSLQDQEVTPLHPRRTSTAITIISVYNLVHLATGLALFRSGAAGTRLHPLKSSGTPSVGFKCPIPALVYPSPRSLQYNRPIHHSGYPHHGKSTNSILCHPYTRLIMHSVLRLGAKDISIAPRPSSTIPLNEPIPFPPGSEARIGVFVSCISLHPPSSGLACLKIESLVLRSALNSHVELKESCRSGLQPRTVSQSSAHITHNHVTEGRWMGLPHKFAIMKCPDHFYGPWRCSQSIEARWP